jgi:hypothetical protein
MFVDPTKKPTSTIISALWYRGRHGYSYHGLVYGSIGGNTDGPLHRMLKDLIKIDDGRLERGLITVEAYLMPVEIASFIFTGHACQGYCSYHDIFISHCPRRQCLSCFKHVFAAHKTNNLTAVLQ